ncbi:MAG: ABC transporter permease [Planctomycetes bacterium]|nr:ABC transporter permease [Planctomycetota bacterium]MCP4770488.1 ABC transporter permease [Planctomycetota bacterium]MCP4859928.1 ABC transporter permease [Planctomycetota bacterium]
MGLAEAGAFLLSLYRLVCAELFARRWSALLALLALVVTVGAFHFFSLLASSSAQETRVIQRDIGLNLLILPPGTSVDRYWSLGYAEGSMPDSFLNHLEEQNVANRLVPMVKRRIQWQGRDAMLTGIGQETFKQGMKMKAVFGRSIESGTMAVGRVIANALSLQEGQAANLLGEDFRVERILSTQGDEQDVQIFVSLQDAQRLLQLEGRISEIQALECHCGEDVSDPLAAIRSDLEPLMPGVQIIRRDSLANARRSQRHLAEQFLNFGFPVLVGLCAILIAALSMLNVRERRPEIGVLRALGKTSVWIAMLFLSRAILLGIVGGALGSLVGFLIANAIGPELFQTQAATVSFDFSLTIMSLWMTPFFAAIAALVPAAMAVSEDPVTVLGESS